MARVGDTAFLPAYLATLLHGDFCYEISSTALSRLQCESDEDEKFHARAACLSMAQRGVVVRVLEALVHFEESEPWRSYIDDALASWHAVRDLRFSPGNQTTPDMPPEEAARTMERSTLGLLPAAQAQDAAFVAVLEAIRAAFPPRPLGTEHLDDHDGFWYDYSRIEAFESGLRGRTWTELIPEFIQAHNSALYRMGAAAFSMFLPAYLASLLRDTCMEIYPVLIALTRHPDWADRFDMRISGLSGEQRAVVPRVLELLPRFEHLHYEADSIAAALASWRAV